MKGKAESKKIYNQSFTGTMEEYLSCIPIEVVDEIIRLLDLDPDISNNHPVYPQTFRERLHNDLCHNN